MMSGRGLGHTGGTLDKLESIDGFDINLSEQRFKDILRSTGCAIVSTTAEMAPVRSALAALSFLTFSFVSSTKGPTTTCRGIAAVAVSAATDRLTESSTRCAT